MKTFKFQSDEEYLFLREIFESNAVTHQSLWSRFWQSFLEIQTYTQLIDISSHNIVTMDDWKILVDAGVKGVYIRYFIGNRLDIRFHEHLLRAVDAGIECIGAYGVPFDNIHFGIARDHFFEGEFQIEEKTGGFSLPCWNDIELTFSDTVSERQKFHTDLITSIPKMEIYSAAWFWNQYFPGVSFPHTKKAVANYTSANTPHLPSGWLQEDITFWQYNIWKKYPWHDISFAPIPYALDQDRFYGTEEELKAKAGYAINSPPNDLEERVTELEKKQEMLKGLLVNHVHEGVKPSFEI